MDRLNKPTDEYGKIISVSERNVFFHCYIGANRTGKTVTAVKHATEWVNSRDMSNHQVVAYDPQNRFREAGIVDEFIDAEDRDWCVKIKDYKNMLVVFDDFRGLNESNRPDPGLRALLGNRTSHRIDIMMIIHQPKDILPAIGTFISHFFIFPMNVLKKTFSDRIPDSEACIAASRQINLYVLNHFQDREQAGDVGFKNGKRFPYALVNTYDGKTQYINCDLHKYK